MKEAVTVSLAFPSMVYYLGVLSVEQGVLVLSLLVILANQWILIQGILLILISQLDSGNAIVVGVFIILYRSVFALSGRVPTFLIFLSFAGVLSVVFVLGYTILPYFSGLPFLSDAVNAVFISMQSSDLIYKYPVLLRPVITFLNFVFSTPSSIKVPVAYILAIVGISFCAAQNQKLRRFYRLNQMKHETRILRNEKLILASAFSTILLFVFIAPTYANAKYYIFLLPVFLLIPIHVFGVWKVLVFSQIMSFLVIFQLLIFRMI